MRAACMACEVCEKSGCRAAVGGDLQKIKKITICKRNSCSARVSVISIGQTVSVIEELRV